ncbi:MAG: amidohydrolase [Thermoplasmata archaeon]
MKTACSNTLFFNGRIYTLSSRPALARAMAVGNGRIIAVGNDDEVRRCLPRGAERVDLRGRPVVPGFIDCHTHFVQMGVDALNVDLSQTKSLKEALQLMGKRAAETPEGEWVIGVNWKESAWPDGRFIDRKDLDSCCPNHPAVAHRVCGHLSTVNSRAIDELGIDVSTPDVDVVRGKLTGVLRESAVALVRRATQPDRATRLKGLGLAIKKAHSLGVTSIHDNGEACDLGLYAEFERTRKLKVRVWFNTPSAEVASRRNLALVHGIGSEWLKVGGVKIFCDGALGARTAALSEPYADDPANTGIFVHDEGEFDDLVDAVNEAGIQLAIHAIGDRGIERAISAVERAVGSSSRKDLRHRIEHLELPVKGHLRRMRRLGMLASMQPNFVGEWGGSEGMYLSRLGPVRVAANNPFRDVLRAGVELVFGSDCMPFSPLYGIHSAVNAPFPAQRIGALEALTAYTSAGAFASFEEHDKGRLTGGMMADFVVLSRDPFEDTRNIRGIEVLKTVLGGETVFAARP